MKWNAAYAISAAFALALTAVLAGQAHAGPCGDGMRVKHGDVQSLDADWNSRANLLRHGKLGARNKFSQLGIVVAEADTDGVAEEDVERSCMAQFEASSASATCANVSAEFHEPDRCFISAVCTLSGGGTNGTAIEASWSDTAKITNCNGILAVEGC